MSEQILDSVVKNSPVEDLLFGVDKSQRYHQRCRNFFDRIHLTLMFLVILCALTAFSQIAWTGPYLALLAVMWAGLDLVIASPRQARNHEMLFRRFSALADSIQITEASDDRLVQQWNDKRIQIESDEPAIYWAVEASCYNEVTRAWGREISSKGKKQLLYLPFWQRLLMHLFLFQSKEFTTIK